MSDRAAAGKTTLCKIILGLLEPVEGEILLGNTPIQNVGISAYRKIIGTVMQDDVLLSGTIRDNISFFDTNVDDSWIQGMRCAGSDS
ncbi:ATP-binding cassette domain-containing protein [Massilia sp. B-10]|nr:ATP-binding cassette domain-containing protein [Massilia sp. B-10]UUZ55058.1 ATP-binding cassette domain-containing protein [Massilia sp. H-1]